MSTQSNPEELDVRERILREATRLFAERGYGSTSVREVVEAAGVTKPTLYYWFANKEALFLEAVEANLEGYNQLVAETLQVEGTVRERLRHFVEQYVQGALDNLDAVRLLMTVQHPTDADQPEVDVMTVHLQKMDLLEQVLREGIERGELRDDLEPRSAVLAFNGMAHLFLMAQVFGLGVPDTWVDDLMDIFFHGVADS